LSAIVGTSNVTFSYTGRSMPLVGRKVFGLVPLGFQRVDSNDSVFRGLINANGKGLNTSYQDMLKKAFQPKFWDSTQSVAIGAAPPGGTAPQGTQIEANFALFFGLATQTYESALVSSNAPFDKFMEGN